jgi:hypothetical protein
MKLTILDVKNLLRGLRSHPRLAEHVAGLDLERMRAKELVALASELGSDARALIDAVREQDVELIEHSRKFPAFKGRLEFDLTVEVFGKRVTRKARADYSHTPEWEYWDLRKRAPHVGWPQSNLSISIRTIPSKDGSVGGPEWEDVDVLNFGEIWDILDDEIERRCKAEDAKRRRAASHKRRHKVAPVDDIARGGPADEALRWQFVTSAPLQK